MLNDTLIQHIHSSFAEGSGSGHGHHSVIAGQQPHGEMIDTDTCRVQLTHPHFCCFFFFRLLASCCQSRSEASVETSEMLLNLDCDVFKALLPFDFINKTRLTGKKKTKKKKARHEFYQGYVS